jgi:3-oxoacyl-[acyl-carrier protein] reductase
MIILITGGASGLGLAITKQLATNKSNTIYVTYNSSEATAKALTSEFENVKMVHCDFKKEESLHELVQQIESIQPDVIINNALASLDTNHFHKTHPSEFLNGFASNILPIISITQACISVFRKKKFGKIITILSSYIINKPPIGLSRYVAEKNYLLSLSKSWAIENAKFNITSNCVSPSTMKTNLTANTDERVVEEMTNQHPLKQLLQVEEVADTVNYLVNASQQINGTNLIINAASDLI